MHIVLAFNHFHGIQLYPFAFRFCFNGWWEHILNSCACFFIFACYLWLSDLLHCWTLPSRLITPWNIIPWNCNGFVESHCLAGQSLLGYNHHSWDLLKVWLYLSVSEETLQNCEHLPELSRLLWFQGLPTQCQNLNAFYLCGSVTFTREQIRWLFFQLSKWWQFYFYSCGWRLFN